MNYREYGKENSDVIILLHGGGLSWWNYREAAEMLQTDYHVILPVLDGHAGSDRGFTTIEDNAGEIISFIDRKFGGSVLMMGGLSLGAQVLLEILSRRGDICRYALIESALVMPSEFTHSMIAPAINICHGLTEREWFARLQFRSLRIKQDLFPDYFRDSAVIKKEDMIAFLQANTLFSLKQPIGKCAAEVHIFSGGKEKRAIRKSAKIIHDKIPGSRMHILPDMYHGEFSINHAAVYANKVLEIINSDNV